MDQTYGSARADACCEVAKNEGGSDRRVSEAQAFVPFGVSFSSPLLSIISSCQYTLWHKTDG